MSFRVRPPWSLLAARHNRPRPRPPGRRPPSRRIHASANSGRSGAGQGNFLLPGATAAVLVMLGALHARRMYDDKKVVDRKEKGIEPEFSPDIKASFFRLLPLRSMSRFWGSLMELEVPVFMRPTIYKAWARAFHSGMSSTFMMLAYVTVSPDKFISQSLLGLHFKASKANICACIPNY
uniref:PSD1 n=1 Tax=Arundo donax TaxID=35708 RepID=A0A0A9DRG8_ARUDO